MRHRHLLLFGLLVSAALTMSIGCGEPTEPPPSGPKPDTSSDVCTDEDGDGYDAVDSCAGGTDCDDSDPSVHPDAEDVCGNGVDEDCSGSDATCGDVGPDTGSCTDNDNDGYGEEGGCMGMDCDDNNPTRHPGAEEVCGNDVDENCDGEDKKCAAKCTDEDGDGFGKEEENGGCMNEAADCDDADPDVHPQADEVCNDVDDNCNGKTDECENSDATCTQTDNGKVCRLSLGDACQDGMMCPKEAVCDPGSGECRKPQGAQCSMGECVDALTCNAGKCQGSFCSNTTCPSKKPRCDDRQSRCVECRYWGMIGATNCMGGEECVAKGWCGKRLTLDSKQTVSPYGVEKSVFEMSKMLADCWKAKFDAGNSPDMCAGIETNATINSVQHQDIKDAFKKYEKANNNGNLKDMTQDQFKQLAKVLGEDGWTDLPNLEWKDDVMPSSKAICIWYDNHGTFGRAKLHVQKCSDFDL